MLLKAATLEQVLKEWTKDEGVLSMCLCVSVSLSMHNRPHGVGGNMGGCEGEKHTNQTKSHQQRKRGLRENTMWGGFKQAPALKCPHETPADVAYFA